MRILLFLPFLGQLGNKRIFFVPNVLKKTDRYRFDIFDISLDQKNSIYSKKNYLFGRRSYLYIKVRIVAVVAICTRIGYLAIRTLCTNVLHGYSYFVYQWSPWLFLHYQIMYEYSMATCKPNLCMNRNNFVTNFFSSWFFLLNFLGDQNLITKSFFT